MKNLKLPESILIISIVAFMAFIFYGINVNINSYIIDNIISIAVMIFFYFVYKKFRLTPTIYALIAVSMALHCAGVFGWYANSPLPIAWDHITHLGLFAWAMALWRFLEVRIKTKYELAVIVFLMILGIGSVIELSEFIGYLNFGFGEGVFMFGAGDGFIASDIPIKDVIDSFGGGWFNTGWDLIWNSLGAALGIMIMTIQGKKKSLLKLYKNLVK